jgi:AcrR family transcriptional regulator
MARISKEKQEEIRQKIKVVSRRLIGDLGFNNVSTKMIAQEVGIAEGTLFNYFDSKTEIFFESFGDEYAELGLYQSNSLQLAENVSEILVEHFQKSMKMVLKLPRGIMSELAIASVKMARKKPERFKKLMEYDFKFIDGITEYIQRLKDHNMISEVDSEMFSEIIFSIIGYEVLLYMYDLDISKEKLFENMKKKIDVLVKGYLKGGIV